MRLRRPSPSMLVALSALFVALAGTGTAATLLITSAQIKDGTIQLVDMSAKARSELKGTRGTRGQQGLQGQAGAKGDTGPQGPKGDSGAQGAQGVQGPAGAPATALWAR